MFQLSTINYQLSYQLTFIDQLRVVPHKAVAEVSE